MYRAEGQNQALKRILTHQLNILSDTQLICILSLFRNPARMKITNGISQLDYGLRSKPKQPARLLRSECFVEGPNLVTTSKLLSIRIFERIQKMSKVGTWIQTSGPGRTPMYFWT